MISVFIPGNRPDPSEQDFEDLFRKLPEYGEWPGICSGWVEGLTDEDRIPEVIQAAFNVAGDQTIKPYITLEFESENLAREESDLARTTPPEE